MSDRWSEIDDVDLLQLESEMRQDLNDLREAATVYAERSLQRKTLVTPQRSAIPLRSAVRQGWLAWVAAGAVAATLAVGGVRLAQREVPQEDEAIAAPAPASSAAKPVSDEALMEQIQHDLTTGVPVAMEPLQTTVLHPAAQETVPQHD